MDNTLLRFVIIGVQNAHPSCRWSSNFYLPSVLHMSTLVGNKISSEGSTSARRSAKGGRKRRNQCVVTTNLGISEQAIHPSVSIFPIGYTRTPTHSPTSPTLRAARAHDVDLLNYSFKLTVTVPPWARHQDSQGYSGIFM